MKKRYFFENLKKKFHINRAVPVIVMIVVLGLSIGYSAFSSSLNITGIVSNVKVKKDIRVTGVSLAPDTENIIVPQGCNLVSDADSSGTITIGDEYSCDPGDGTYRTFYVLETGDNISLIMDSNIDNETVTWCASGTANTCNGDGALAALATKTTGWTVDVSLPTYDQIYAVNNSTDLTNTPWLYGNLPSTTGYPYGYWTGTKHDSVSYRAWRVYSDKTLDGGNTNESRYMGIRPVITVPKVSSISSYQEYNVNSIYSTITLPTEDSSITFNVEITNIEAQEMGILEITGLPDNLDYELLNYELKEKICDDTGKCSLGIKKTIQVKVKYKENGYDSSNTTYNIGLNFNFQPIYTITYTDIELESEEVADSSICKLENDLEPSGISYGDEYSCDPGDGTYRTFYVLEDGDNTTLTKGTTGTAGPGEVSLIMDRNIDDNLVTWCDQSGSNPSNNICAGDGAKAALATKTSGWTNSQILSIDLPTGYQVARAVGDTSWTPSSSRISISSVPWLYGNLDSAAIFGYWTSTADAASTTSAWVVYYTVRLDRSYVNTHYRGIRPVITVAKSSSASYPTEIIGGEKLEVNLGSSAPSNVKVLIDGVEITDYTYSNGVLTIPSVNGNVEISEATSPICTLSTETYNRSDFVTPDIIISDTIEVLTCGSEQFYVMSNDGTTMKVLAKYNLGLSTSPYLQDTSGATNSITFWESSPEVWPESNSNAYDNTDNLIKPYVETYESYLINTLGMSGINARLMTHDEALSFGFTYPSGEIFVPTLPENLYSPDYILATFNEYEEDNDYSYFYGIREWYGLYSIMSPFNNIYGIRPLIEVPIDVL